MKKRNDFCFLSYRCSSVVKIGGASLRFGRVISMPGSATPQVRKDFDYTILDAETSRFIQQQTGEIQALMKRTAQDIFEIGQKLIEVKKTLGHGHFETWLRAEFDWGEWTARKFMQVAHQFAAVKFTDLQIAPSALYLLAASSTPDAAKAEVLARAQAGEHITNTTAKAIKQKYTSPPVKPQPQLEPETASLVQTGIKQKYTSPPATLQPQLKPETESASLVQTLPTQAPLLQVGSKLEIVAIHRQPQAPALFEATGAIEVSQVTPTLSTPQPSPSVSPPEKLGSWWQLGKRHLLYCGDPNSPEFLTKVKEEVQLLFAFPPVPGWVPMIKAQTCITSNKYSPQSKDARLFEDTLESMLLLCSDLGDVVVACFLPSPEILSLVNRLDRRGFFAEPNPKRVNALISDWKKAGLKAERLN